MKGSGVEIREGNRKEIEERRQGQNGMGQRSCRLKQNLEEEKEMFRLQGMEQRIVWLNVEINSLDNEMKDRLKSEEYFIHYLNFSFCFIL